MQAEVIKVQDSGLYNIKVTNIIDNSVWNHKRVPGKDVENLKFSPNLKVEVVKYVGFFELKNQGFREPKSQGFEH